MLSEETIYSHSKNVLRELACTRAKRPSKPPSYFDADIRFKQRRTKTAPLEE